MHQSAPIWTLAFPALIVALVLWRRGKTLARPLRGPGWGFLIAPVVMLALLPTVFLDRSGHLAQPAPTWELLAAVLAGLVFAAPLMWFTRYERREDGQIYHQQSGALLVAFAALVVVRLALRSLLDGLSEQSLNALFFLTAITYLTTWRLTSLVKYRRVLRS